MWNVSLLLLNSVVLFTFSLGCFSQSIPSDKILCLLVGSIVVGKHDDDTADKVSSREEFVAKNPMQNHGSDD